MSDFSSSFRAETDRAAARLAVLAPGGRTRVFRGAADDVSDLEAFAVIAESAPETPRDFVPAADKAHRVAATLGSVISEQWLRLPLPRGLKDLGVSLCRRAGISSVVGSRTTWTEVRGWREYYFVRAGAVPAAGALGDRFWDVVMSSGALGHLPLVGATAASAAVCVAGLLLMPFLPDAGWRASMVMLALISTALCVAGEKRAQRLYLAEDPREVVLDEVAGMAAALALAGSGVWAIAAAFFAFRFFDIFKVGVHWVEKRGWAGSIVWDDVLAGWYAGALVWLARWVGLVP
jgi:phosphatidylglycerophosphatase A